MPSARDTRPLIHRILLPAVPRCGVTCDILAAVALVLLAMGSDRCGADAGRLGSLRSVTRFHQRHLYAFAMIFSLVRWPRSAACGRLVVQCGVREFPSDLPRFLSGR